MLEHLPPPLRRFVLYSFCGGLGAALDTLVFAGLTALGVWYQWANVAGYASGTLLSFGLNRAITFGVLDAPLRRMATFFAVATLGYLSSAVTLWLMIERLGVGAIAAKLLSLVVVVAVQFSLNSAITFRQR